MLRFSTAFYRARIKFRRLQAQDIPIMEHSFLFGHLSIVRHFFKDWASDANFIQTFGQYMSLYWKRFFPQETTCPPVIYVDVWPIAKPMAFSMEAYVSNQIETGKIILAKSPMQGEFLRPISNGRDLNCMHGEEWRTRRYRFNPGFGKANVRGWVPEILEEVEVFADLLRERSGKNGEWGEVFQLEKMAGNLAFDATGRMVVSTRLNSQSSSPEEFEVLYREQLENMEITLNPIKLLWMATPIFTWLTGRRRDQLYSLLRPFILSGMTETAQEPCTVVQAAVKESKQESTTKPNKADEEEFISLVFSQLMIFFFGGEDAISIVIPWMFKRLSENPQVLSTLRAEHDELFGPDPKNAAEKIRQAPHIIDSLKYSHAVIKETLRINPATITIREGQPDFTLHIPSHYPSSWPTADFDLFDSSITIHRDPRNFIRPLEFLPERFLVQESHELFPAKNAWRGFQLGPRKCIGQELAVVISKLVLVCVVRSVDIEMAWEEWDALRESRGEKVDRRVVEGERMYTTGKATSHPKDGGPVRVRRRC